MHAEDREKKLLHSQAHILRQYLPGLWADLCSTALLEPAASHSSPLWPMPTSSSVSYVALPQQAPENCLYENLWCPRGSLAEAEQRESGTLGIPMGQPQRSAPSSNTQILLFSSVIRARMLPFLIPNFPKEELTSSPEQNADRVKRKAVFAHPPKAASQ